MTGYLVAAGVWLVLAATDHAGLFLGAALFLLLAPHHRKDAS